MKANESLTTSELCCVAT